MSRHDEALKAQEAKAGGAKPAVPRTGSVKWFDSVKGFGFIADDAGGGDILLHANVLKNFGHSSVAEGTRMEVLALETPRGLQAAQVLSLVPPETGQSPERGGLVEAEGPWLPARVKWFDRVKGFGFVNVFGSTEDVFVHMEVLRANGLAELVQGEAVCVRTAQGPRGLMAADVRPWDFAAETAATHPGAGSTVA